jgi:hypothetical protein
LEATGRVEMGFSGGTDGTDSDSDGGSDGGSGKMQQELSFTSGGTAALMALGISTEKKIAAPIKVESITDILLDIARDVTARHPPPHARLLYS